MFALAPWTTYRGRIGGEELTITFHGVRGSTPCHGPGVARYGGNTSCVSLLAPGHDPVLFDLGTGLRYFGLSLPHHQPFRGTCLLSHLHWDHVQGLPFFIPLLRAGSELEVFAPAPDDHTTVAEVMAATIAPPLFPVSLEQLPGHIGFHDVADDVLRLRPIASGDGQRRIGPDPISGGSAPDDPDDEDLVITTGLVPHIGPTCGYRVSWRGRTVCYMSDHQQPRDGSFMISERALDLARNADVLIHDAQYTAAEFARKRDWGHCMVDYAVWVASHARVRTLVLFHHDPAHDDELVDVLTATAARAALRSGVQVIAAHEGMRLNLRP